MNVQNIRDTFKAKLAAKNFAEDGNLEIVAAGKAAAARLGLEFEHRHVGLESFSKSIPVTFLNSTAKQ